MPVFFVPELTEHLSITGEDAAHIARSLRLGVGDHLTLCDGKGWQSEGIILSCDPTSVSLSCSPPAASTAEPACFITLYQAMPKGDKAETIIQKSVELGVGEIVFFLSSRCISRPDSKEFGKKLVRYNKISLEAAKQCGRGRIPLIRGLLSFEDLGRELGNHQTSVLFYEDATKPLRELLPSSPKTLALIIGSEGGFAPSEADKLGACGAVVASLGSRILRCETAPLAALAAIQYHCGEF